MATLEDLEGDVAGQLLAVVGAVALVSWSEPPSGPAASGIKTARVRIAQTDQVVAGSNLTMRIAEVVVEVWIRASNIWSMETQEISVNEMLAEIVDVAFWTGCASVRSSPTPEMEIESEPERIGEVITFQVRARVALET